MSFKFLVSLLGITTAYAAHAQEQEVIFVPSPMVQEIPEQPEVNLPAKQLDCLARVIHHEARGEGRKGQEAVGYVVLNRKHDGRFPSTVCRVATQPYQFTNFRLNKRIGNYDYFYSVAQDVVSEYDESNDPSNGALYFHTTNIKPYWSRNKRASARIKRHVFYR